MEIPFYLGFREFEKNYYNNLERWFEQYHNTSEIDFLRSLVMLYKSFLSYSFTNDQLQADATIEVKNCFFSSHENYGISFHVDRNSKNSKTKPDQVSEVKTISMMEYAQCVLDKINAYFQQRQISMKENETILDYLNHYEIITLKEKNGYCLNYDQHQKTIPFLKAYLPHSGSTVDISLYRNFYFSVVKIADFIDQKLNEIRAFDQSIYSELKSEAMMKIHMRGHSFLTICN
ncbi:hypothetical protein CHRY9390_00689 [Chryseobacterium aquaeductus]|uniref:Uncharacterized protein n=1 Tax=Chryseobacterium aquaeductus TaxID=2675056 RepID=A0A9N8MEA8_9FLAO|nr:hypothetical protein [Chryseobacterium aquaeductus]CAA7330039.1 hypothetical protein CHRY9390_00689 [Chryseobacterium potabilaquae]CAD7800845.1 hypothetical protein CHRY9390_00689 [Chryseobacterium aquaeductus]